MTHKTHQGVETERPPADPQTPPQKRSTVGGVIFNVLLQNGADTRRSEPRGVLAGVSSLLSFLSQLHSLQPSLEKSRRGQTHPRARKVSPRTQKQILTSAQTNTYICRHARLFS